MSDARPSIQIDVLPRVSIGTAEDNLAASSSFSNSIRDQSLERRVTQISAAQIEHHDGNDLTSRRRTFHHQIMGKRDERVDAYIKKSAPFARPILKHLRSVVHTGCPAVQEAIKWQFPHFDYKGMICGMAAFKNHCSFGFWKAELVFGNHKTEEEAMGHFGRIMSMADLPSEKTLIRYVRKAAKLNEQGVKRPVRRKPKKAALQMPDYFAAALEKNDKAKKTFASFSPSNKRDYVEWLTEAKRDETRGERLALSLRWLAEGKPRNWKYMPEWR